MNTEQPNLDDTLRELRAELREPDALDDRSRELLRQLAADIDTILAPSEQTTEEHYEGVRQRLREGIERFEASHPALTANMQMAIDALSRMGI